MRKIEVKFSQVVEVVIEAEYDPDAGEREQDAIEAARGELPDSVDVDYDDWDVQGVRKP